MVVPLRIGSLSFSWRCSKLVIGRLNVAIYIIVNIAVAILSAYLLEQAWFSQMSTHVDVGLDSGTLGF